MSFLEEIGSLPDISDPQLVGEGGFGLVFRAWQESLGREVAVKVARLVVATDVARRRFEDECRAAGALSTHPNVVTVHSSGFTGAGRPYLVMEYLPGGSLGDRLAADGPMDWADALSVGAQVGHALEAAHALGLLHRDVKPENILVSRFGEPMLADFGLALVSDDAAATASGSLVTSLAHTAPELLTDGSVATVASDVYALASTVFALAHGSAPFWRDHEPTVFPLLSRIVTGDLPDLRSSGVPVAFCELLEQSLDRDPTERPASAGVFAAACDRIGADLGVDPRRTLPERLAAEGTVDLGRGRPLPGPDVEETVRLGRSRPLPGADPEGTVDLGRIRQSPVPDAAATVDLGRDRPPGIGAEPRRRGRRVPMIAAAVVVLLVATLAVVVFLQPDEGNEPRARAGQATATPTSTTDRVAPTTTAPEADEDPPTSSEDLDGTPFVRPPASGEADDFPRITTGARPAATPAIDQVTGQPFETVLEPAADQPALEIGADLTCRDDRGTAPLLCAVAHGAGGWFAMAVWNTDVSDDCVLVAEPPSCAAAALYRSDGDSGRYVSIARTDFASTDLFFYDIAAVPFTSGGEQAIALHYASGGASSLTGYLEVVTWDEGAEPVVAAHAGSETNGGMPRAHADGILLVDFREREVLDLYRTESGEWTSVDL